MTYLYSDLKSRVTTLDDQDITGTTDDPATLRTVLEAVFEAPGEVQPLPVDDVVFWLAKTPHGYSLVGITPDWHNTFDETTDASTRREMLLDRFVHHPQGLTLTTLASTLCAAGCVQYVAGSPVVVALTGVPARRVAIVVLDAWWRREQAQGLAPEAAFALLRLSGFPDLHLAAAVVGLQSNNVAAVG